VSLTLEKFDVLREFSSEELEQVSEFWEELVVEDGRTVFGRGEEAEELLLVRSGGIRLERGGETLGELGEGACLGAASLVRIGKRECTALACGSLSLFRLSRESYLRLRADYPRAALMLQESVLRRLLGTVERMLRD
jgi:CRP-like cAMP-binding protein